MTNQPKQFVFGQRYNVIRDTNRASITAEQMVRQETLVAHSKELQELQEKPEWWLEHRLVPPLEPFDRFLAWLELELREVRTKILETRA